MNLFITVYINWECVLKIRLLLMNWALKSSCYRLRKLGTSNKKEKERKKRKKNGSICMTKQGWPHCGEEGGLAGVSADTEGLTGRRNGGIYCETPSSISNPPPPAPPTPTLHPRHLWTGWTCSQSSVWGRRWGRVWNGHRWALPREWWPARA